MIFEHLTKEKLIQKVVHSAIIFKHEGLYTLDVNWDSNTGIVTILVKAEAINEDTDRQTNK